MGSCHEGLSVWGMKADCLKWMEQEAYPSISEVNDDIEVISAKDIENIALPCDGSNGTDISCA